MFPNNYAAQGFGQQYPFNVNNGPHMTVPMAKRPCLPLYPGQVQYPHLPFHMMQHQPFYPQNFGYPVQSIISQEAEIRRRKTIQVVTEDNERPIWTFTGMTILALLNAPEKTATTDEIYKFVLNNFPFFIDQPYPSWTGAIRHNLTKKKNLFERIAESGKRSGKWKIVSEETAKEEILKEIQKKKKNEKSGMKNKDDFDALVGRFLNLPVSPTEPVLTTWSDSFIVPLTDASDALVLPPDTPVSEGVATDIEQDFPPPPASPDYPSSVSSYSESVAIDTKQDSPVPSRPAFSVQEKPDLIADLFKKIDQQLSDPNSPFSIRESTSPLPQVHEEHYDIDQIFKEIDQQFSSSEVPSPPETEEYSPEYNDFLSELCKDLF